MNTCAYIIYQTIFCDELQLLASTLVRPAILAVQRRVSYVHHGHGNPNILFAPAALISNHVAGLSICGTVSHMQAGVSHYPCLHSAQSSPLTQQCRSSFLNQCILLSEHGTHVG